MGMKGQVCEAGTIVTRFQVCSLCVCFASGWYNVVAEGRNRLRKRVCKCSVISVLKLLMSVWNVLSLWKEGVYLLCSFLRLRVFFMVLYLCRHWLLSCVRCLDDPGAGFQTEYQQSPLSFALSLPLSVSLSRIWTYTRGDFRSQNTDELVCTHACLCTLNRSYHPPECHMYIVIL